MVKIEKAALRDIDEIRKVGISSWNDTYSNLMSEMEIESALSRWWSESYLASTISSSTHITLVAKLAGQMIAYTECEVFGDVVTHIPEMDASASPKAVLWKLYVLRGHRRRGIGSSLLGEVIHLLPDSIEILFVEYVQGNNQAHSFYANHRFVFYCEQKPQTTTGVPHIWMKRQLR